MEKSINNHFNSRELLEKYSGISLRKVAIALNLNYNMLLKQGKKPIEGVPYDASAINYNAVDEYVNARTSEEITNTIDWELLENEANALKVTLPKEFQVGQVVTLRQDDDAYEIIFMTISHIVLNPQNDTQPRVLNLATFLHQGPRVLNDARVNLEAIESPVNSVTIETPKKAKKTKKEGEA